MDIYGYYETDANHDQARFCRRWFFASGSHNKIIGYPIARGTPAPMAERSNAYSCPLAVVVVVVV